MAEIILGLGSNLGDSQDYLRRARSHMSPHIQLNRFSSIISTSAMYVPGQPDFLNQVVVGNTNLEVKETLLYIKEIEKKVGRQKSYRFGPREIDVDLLAYDRFVLDTLSLCVPHMRLYERSFVLEPLVEIYPDWICPRTGKTALMLLRDLRSIGEDATILNETAGF